MEDKEALTILMSMLKKYPFDEKEKKAILTAVGVLSWTSVVKKRMKNKITKKKGYIK